MATGYFSERLTPSHIPNYIKARSPQGLRRLILRNNVKQKGYVKYFDIQYVDQHWYAWYVVEIELTSELNKGGDSDAI